MARCSAIRSPPTSNAKSDHAWCGRAPLAATPATALAAAPAAAAVNTRDGSSLLSQSESRPRRAVPSGDSGGGLASYWRSRERMPRLSAA